MNLLLKISLLLALIAAGMPSVYGDPAKAAPLKPEPVRSVFVMPASTRDGRDPFFPESSRPYEDAMATKNTPETSALVVKGISFEHGHAMVIINNHTFAVGDEGDVLTAGKRVHIRLVEIRASVVVIEVNGTRRELTVAAK